MGQLMGQQPLPGSGIGGVLTAGEGDVAADRVGTRTDRLRRRLSPSIRMNAHVAKIATKAWLEKTPRRRIERAARRVQHRVHRWRHLGGAAACRGSPLNTWLHPAVIGPLRTGRALMPRPALWPAGYRCTHDRIRHPIGVSFEWVVLTTDTQFALQTEATLALTVFAHLAHCRGGLAAGALALEHTRDGLGRKRGSGRELHRRAHDLPPGTMPPAMARPMP